MPGAAALQLAQTGPVLGRQDQPRRSPGSGETLALPFLAQFWKSKVSKLAEVQTWNRGLERLQLPLPPSAGEMQFGHCRVSHCGGCILRGGCTKCTPDLWSFSFFCCFLF